MTSLYWELMSLEQVAIREKQIIANNLFTNTHKAHLFNQTEDEIYYWWDHAI